MKKIKRNIIKIVSFTVLLSITLLIVSGCAQTKPSHLGEWQSDITEEITIQIKDDGTLDEYWENTQTATYTYEIEDNSLIVDQNGDKYSLLIDNGKLVYEGETLYTKK